MFGKLLQAEVISFDSVPKSLCDWGLLRPALGAYSTPPDPPLL